MSGHSRTTPPASVVRKSRLPTSKATIAPATVVAPMHALAPPKPATSNANATQSVPTQSERVMRAGGSARPCPTGRTVISRTATPSARCSPGGVYACASSVTTSEPLRTKAAGTVKPYGTKTGVSSTRPTSPPFASTRTVRDGLSERDMTRSRWTAPRPMPGRTIRPFSRAQR
ncbi:MAG: hypothetical protein LC793_24750 [Thermomicrobia bacterium]|nr:hypothetical protein [Thermomicrobia bacterium]